MFGGSNAFSVGDANGYDLLQMPVNNDGKLYLEEIEAIFAHEIHHTGFHSISNRRLKKVKTEYLSLLGILAAEGMPTWFINRTESKISEYRKSKNLLYRSVASDWEEHTEYLSELYRQAENDIQMSLAGKTEWSSLFEKWMSGVKGPAYILGSDMFKTIEEEISVESAIMVMQDYRQFLKIYNQAAAIANEKGADKFIFDENLAYDVSEFTGK